METNTNNVKITVRISDLLDDLSKGITKLTTDSKYNPERGSIQEKYALEPSEVREIFKHPLLKGRKVSVPKVTRYSLIDDVTPIEPLHEDVNVNEEDELIEEISAEHVEIVTEDNTESINNNF